MAEGDTIRRLAERINARLAGRRVLGCVVRHPRLVGVDLTGAALVGADAVGKHLFLRFDDGRALHVHLGIDGSVVVNGRAAASAFRRRLELTFEGGSLTAVDAPVLELVDAAAEAQAVGHLGPDVCATEPPDLAVIAARLAHEPDVPVAAALLDQRNVAGFGNVFAVELPFIAGVSPNQPVGTVDGLIDLVDVGVAIIRHTMQHGPRNTTGRRLGTPDHWVYGKRGRPCPLCGTRLDSWSDTTSPWGRVSVWCPSCQPLAERRVVDRTRCDRLLALHPARRAMTRPR